MADTAFLASVIAALPLPTLAIDRNERIIALNDSAVELLGSGAYGRHFVTVLRQPTLVDAVEQTLADGKARKAQYLGGDAAREQTFTVNLSRIAAADALLVSFQDVTSEAEAGQMRRDFVANVSHELRTPLTALMGFIETLSGPARDDAAARDRFLAIMAGEAGRMNRLVGDLLSLSRVEGEERVKPDTRVDLTAILRSTVRNLNPLAVDNDVTLVPEFGSDPLALLGDADQLQQVFTNLIENAIKYGGPDQKVIVTAETSLRDPALRGPGVRIIVTDHGPGIDAQHLPRLTERFYRADSHRSRALGGTGLGLAIVKHILNRHRGRLKIISEPGKGASFIVILPMDAGQKSEETPDPTP
ncbi:Phosphate regulon sensor histidine kinase [Sulfitobacter noctilucae]|uniref:ATP-binding protein n=1 Tax=Sulfitobacter noctilucae TaxID=1342302 RepID=UPI000469D842|nr:ATP-binding protein [Sulfitobacter noctilucae]KIN61091.1 Phosphate regulon sensor histidine kinase [Sulfitobacter noctilucae]